MKYVLVPVYIFMSIAGLILIKLGGNPGSLTYKDNSLGFSINVISAIGFLSYIISFFIFTRIVILFDLSYILPICTGIVQIITLIASAIVFNEKVTVTSVIGVIIILIGIIIMNIKQKV